MGGLRYNAHSHKICYYMASAITPRFMCYKLSAILLNCYNITAINCNIRGIYAHTIIGAGMGLHKIIVIKVAICEDYRVFDCCN